MAVFFGHGLLQYAPKPSGTWALQYLMMDEKGAAELARCVVPDCDGASLPFIRQEEDALWQAFFTTAPERRRIFEPSSKRRNRAAGPLPPATA